MSYKLSYFDFNGSRGLVLRLAFSVAGIKFEDNRIPHGQWPEFKGTTPTGTVPTLELDGTTFSQTSAILRFIGKKDGKLYPSDDLEALKVDEILDFLGDVSTPAVATMRMQDAEQKKQARIAMGDKEGDFGKLLTALTGLVERNGKKFTATDELSIADIAFLQIWRWLAGGALDDFPVESLNNFPKLKATYEAVGADARVKAYIDSL